MSLLQIVLFITWENTYWPLIDTQCSRDLNTGLWLVRSVVTAHRTKTPVRNEDYASIATNYQRIWLIWAKNDSWILWSMTSFSRSQRVSLIGLISSLIWLESGFNQITALIITAKQMLSRRRLEKYLKTSTKAKCFSGIFHFPDIVSFV